MSVRLSEADPGEGAALGAILSDWIDATPWMPRLHTRAEDAGFWARLIAGGGVLVARDGAGPLGFLAQRGEEIAALYLAAPARGRGIGAALLAAAAARAPRLTLWTFAANTGAQRFYLRQGFRVIETGDGSGNDEGLPDLRLLREGATP